MKKTNTALTAFAVLGFGALAFAAQTYDEALRSREQAIQDWKTVTAALKKAGVKEDNSAYKRVHEALKKNETRLKHLTERGRSAYKDLRSGKPGLATTAAGAAAGSGVLGKLGSYFGGSKETPAAVKAKPITVTKTTRTVTKPAKKKAKPWGLRGKKAKKRHATKHAVKHAPAKKS